MDAFQGFRVELDEHVRHAHVAARLVTFISDQPLVHTSMTDASALSSNPATSRLAPRKPSSQRIGEIAFHAGAIFRM